ncbi:MAG: TIGR00730 family Rossman fold protein [Byssovorax sp.]
MPSIQRVCVFCGGNPGKNPAYLAAAVHLGSELGSNGLELVYGGAQVGLMGAVADAAIAHGGEVFGVIPEFIAAREIAHLGVTRLVVVPSMHERKAAMAERADAFVALPGGFGTLDELFEILTWAQLGLHRKPIAVLNIAGYFDHLLAFLDHAADEQLLRPEYRAMLLVESDPGRLVARLRESAPPVVETWLEPGQT